MYSFTKGCTSIGRYIGIPKRRRGAACTRGTCKHHKAPRGQRPQDTHSTRSVGSGICPASLRRNTYYYGHRLCYYYGPQWASPVPAPRVAGHNGHRLYYYYGAQWRTMAQMAPLCAREQIRRPADDGDCLLLFFSVIFFLFFSFLFFFSLLLLYGILCYLVPVILFYLVL